MPGQETENPNQYQARPEVEASIETNTPGPEEQVLDIPVPQGGGMARPETVSGVGGRVQEAPALSAETLKGAARGEAARMAEQEAPPERKAASELFYIEPGETWWSRKYPAGLYETLVRFTAPYTPGHLYVEIIREGKEGTSGHIRHLASLFPEDSKYGGPLSFRADVSFNLTVKNMFAEKISVTRMEVHRIHVGKEEAPLGEPNPNVGQEERRGEAR